MRINFNELYSVTKNLNVLYIEDDLHFREETVDIFEDIFKNVDTASNGQEGLDLYKTHFITHNTHYDIVITDINMPKMNGIELTKNIYLENEDQAIIVISAHNENEYLLELINLGIEQFLMKPLDFELISQVLFTTAKKLYKKDNTIVDLNTVILSQSISYSLNTSKLLDNNNLIKLTRNETILMNLFTKNRDKVSSIEEILNLIQIETTEILSVDSLKPIISRLRKKLPEESIENIYGLGYRFIL